MPAAADEILIQNFQESSTRAIACPTLERSFASGVFCLDLRGAIGEGEAICLRSVTERLSGRSFEHLHIRITSTGGDVREGFRLYSYLRSFPVPVSAEAVTQCLSMAMVLLMAGDFRFALADTEFLNHPTNSARETLPQFITASILRDRAAKFDETDEQIANLFAARTGHHVEWFRDDAKTEESLGHADAILSGLLHEVVGLPQRINPAWAGVVKALPQGTYLPQYLRSANYLAACRAAASLYGVAAP